MPKLDWNAYDQRHNKSGVPPEKGIARLQMQGTSLMNFAVDRFADSWLTRKDFTYHILRASMVIIISVRLKTKQIQLDIILCSIVSVG